MQTRPLATAFFQVGPPEKGESDSLSAGAAYIPALIPALISLHFRCDLTGWNALKTPLFGDPDTEFENHQSLCTQSPAKRPPMGPSHQLTQTVWAEVRRCQGDPQGNGKLVSGMGSLRDGEAF